jgi:hypothetical protein
MGKIEITEDLRNKLDKVLSYKSVDIGDTAVGPASTWKPPQQPPQPQHQQPPQPQHQQPPQPQHQQPPHQPPPPQYQQPPQQPPPPQYQHPLPNYINPIAKSHKKKNKMKYDKITKVVFLSSVIAGIGITLGIKIANFLFF